jgi:hypothetical protein
VFPHALAEGMQNGAATVEANKSSEGNGVAIFSSNSTPGTAKGMYKQKLVYEFVYNFIHDRKIKWK